MSMAFGGEPVVGVVPAQLIVHGELTRMQAGFVQARFAQFCTATRLSIAPSTTLNYTLPDGSKMRAASIFGVNSVHVWPVAPEDLTDPSTFFCIPFDETYLAAQIRDTYRLKRWPDVDAIEHKKLLDKLEKLRNCDFMPSARVSHPGNQTWFAHIEGETKHEFANMVLSWWGHPNRYNYSPLDAFLMRTPPSAESVIVAGGKLLYPAGLENDKAIYPRAWEDAMAGKFYQLGETSSLEEIEGINPPYATTAGRKAIWFNGVLFRTDFEVNSACIGKRNKQNNKGITEIANVVRIFSTPRGNGGAGNITKKIQILEFPIGLMKSPNGGVLQKSRATVFNLDIPFPSIPDCEDYHSDYWCHPFYWNADGTEAMAILRFTCQFNAPPEYGTGVPVNYSVFGTSLLRLSKTNLGFDLSLMEFSGVTESLTHDDGALIYSGVQSYPLAADFLGDSPMVVRGSISEAVSDSGIAFSTISASASSTVSLNGVPVSELSDTHTKTRSSSYSSTGDYGNYSHSGSVSVMETGRASRWAVAGGDIRGGKIVLRESQWYMTECPSVLHRSTWINSNQSGSSSETRSASDIKPETFIGPPSGYEYVKHTKSTYVETIDKSSHLELSEVGGRFAIIDVVSKTCNTTENMGHPINYKGLGSVTASETGNWTYGYEWELNTVPYAGPSGESWEIGTEVVKDGWWGQCTEIGTPAPPSTVTVINDGLDENAIIDEFPVTSGLSLNAPGDPNFSNRVSLRRYREGIEIRARNAAYTGAGGYADVVFSSGAVSPDGKIQYIGLLSVALAAPNTKTPLPLFKLDKWYANGTEFVPDKDYPKTGAYKMLSSPVFVGPLP